MSAEIAVIGKAGVPEGLPDIDVSAVEKVLLQGDLAKLEPHQRLAYYNSVCKSLNLNPLTRPFEYMVLNGKMMLYAKRECTEQLRKLYNISIVILERAIIEGVFIVRAQAVMPSGRTDESIGAVAIGQAGEARANALMKAETKAKRRVTLSICGMAFLDESEADGLHGAYQVPVDPQTGSIAPLEPGKDLHEDIQNHPPRESAGEKRNASRTRSGSAPFEMLEAFGKLKQRYRKSGAEAAYYIVLGKYGKQHADEFGANDRDEALKCYKEMSLDVQEREHAVRDIPETKRLPDCVELSAGTRMRQGGKIWEVQHGPENSSWVEVQENG